METKSIQKGSEKGLEEVQIATWSDIGCGNRKKGLHIAAYRRSWLHFGSQMGAKLEPKGVKMAIKIASKFRVDFKEHFEAKKMPQRGQKGRKLSQN